MIITITDGNKLTHSSGVPDEVRTQTNSVSLTRTVWDTVIRLCVDLSYSVVCSSAIIIVILQPLCPVAPASELSAGRQRADQRALSLGPASVCIGVETARSSHARQRAARQCPNR